MSQIKTTITRIETDTNDTVQRNVTTTVIDEFDSKSIGSFTLSNKSTFKTINFGEVIKSCFVLLVSTQDLTIKLNGGSQQFITKSFSSQGNLTSIDVRNDTDSESEITYEVYGS